MLEALRIAKLIELRTARITELTENMKAFETRKADIDKREKELEKAIEEVKTDEDQKLVDEAIEKFNADKKQYEDEKAAAEKEISDANAEVTSLQEELTNIEKDVEKTSETPADDSSATETTEERKVTHMNIEKRFRELSYEQRSAFVAKPNIKVWLDDAKVFFKEKRSVKGAELNIPTEVYPLIRLEVEKNSKLLPFFTVRRTKGKGRQPVRGKVQKAVWTEMKGAINELDFKFSMVETDGYKVAGFIPIPNYILEDSDVEIFTEIVESLGESIALTLDEAFVFGKGGRMPIGIVTRLNQTSAPEDESENAPEWTDLHTSNVVKLNISGMTGTSFFEQLILAAGIPKSMGLGGNVFWVMTRKTHLTIMSKALNFDQGGAIVAGMNNTMPLAGGTIIEHDDIGLADNEIIGGFGNGYIVNERQAVKIGTFTETRAIEDETLFIGKARYDGKPLFGECFVQIKIDNVAPTTNVEFTPDYANTELGTLTVTSAAASTTGKTVLTVKGNETSGTTLKYKLGDHKLESGDALGTGWTNLTSGTTQITALEGDVITVAEIDKSAKVIKRGEVKAVPKTS